MYAKYLGERTDTLIIEFPDGFATYRYLNEKQVYIVDIYVEPESRKIGTASLMADIICDDAKKLGRSELIGTVDVTSKGAKASLAVLFAYGMDLVSCNNNLIVLKKDI